MKLNYSYDDIANITSDGKQNYTYNCENRLITVEKTDDYKLEFKYDYQGRRIEKKEYSWVASAWQLDKHEKFVYDGFKLIAETDAQNGDAVVRKYVWNGDSPISMMDADGTFFYVLDGNKNVTELIDSTGATRAHYEYSPFGKVIIKTGDKADDNPIRFSSEYHDDETGLVYYNFRYYNPEIGRWLSRDPIQEMGGYNLYGMVANDPVGRIDYLGLGLLDLILTGKWTATQEELDAGAQGFAERFVPNPLTFTDPNATTLDEIYTDKDDPTDEEYKAAAKGAGEGITCWWKCEKEIHKCVAGKTLLVVEVVSGIGASSAARGMKTAEEIAKASKMFPGRVNPYTSLSRRLLGRRIGRAWGRSATARAAKIAFVTAALAEGAISVHCGVECSK